MRLIQPRSVSRLLIATALATSSCVLLPAASAWACGAVGTYASIDWPQRTSEVSPSTPLWVSLALADAQDEVTFTLRDAQGSPVELRAERVSTGQGYPNSELVILTPMAPLSDAQSYTLEVIDGEATPIAPDNWVFQAESSAPQGALPTLMIQDVTQIDPASVNAPCGRLWDYERQYEVKLAPFTMASPLRYTLELTSPDGTVTTNEGVLRAEDRTVRGYLPVGAAHASCLTLHVSDPWGHSATLPEQCGLIAQSASPLVDDPEAESMCASAPFGAAPTKGTLCLVPLLGLWWARRRQRAS